MKPPRDGLTPEFRGWLHEHDEELSNDALRRFLDEVDGDRDPNLVAMLAEIPGATLTCTVCGDKVPANDWAFHVHSVPTSALESGDLCGQGGRDEPACTLIAGHDGPHEQWEG